MGRAEMEFPSRAQIVDFERSNSIVAVPKPRPKVTKKIVKKVTKVMKVEKPKVVKKPVVKKKTPYVPPQNGSLAGIERIAARYYGVPYVWGGNTPSGFDCSGFTRYVYAKFGVALPRVSRAQFAYTRRISQSSARPGDLVFYGSPVHHVAIYVGNGYMIDAPRRGKVVSKRKIYYSETPMFGRIP
jgi:cell wall-associated NlpC family hydrolase